MKRKASYGVRSSGSVWVGSLGINSSVLDDVCESLVHQTSVASHVSLGGGAINEVLLGEGDEFVVLQEPGSFNGSSGGERPARTALTLVLNSSDGSSFSPIDGGRGSSHDIFWLTINFGDVHAIVDRNEFFASEIGEGVEGNRESTSFLVPVSDEFSRLGEDGESVSLFLHGDVHLVVFGHP